MKILINLVRILKSHMSHLANTNFHDYVDDFTADLHLHLWNPGNRILLFTFLITSGILFFQKRLGISWYTIKLNSCNLFQTIYVFQKSKNYIIQLIISGLNNQIFEILRNLVRILQTHMLPWQIQTKCHDDVDDLKAD